MKVPYELLKYLDKVFLYYPINEFGEFGIEKYCFGMYSEGVGIKLPDPFLDRPEGIKCRMSFEAGNKSCYLVIKSLDKEQLLLTINADGKYAAEEPLPKPIEISPVTTLWDVLEERTA